MSIFEKITQQFFGKKNSQEIVDTKNAMSSYDKQESGKFFNTTDTRLDKNFTYDDFNRYLCDVLPVSNAFNQILQDIVGFGNGVVDEKGDVSDSKTAQLIHDILNVRAVGAEYCKDRKSLFEEILRAIYYGEGFIKIQYLATQPKSTFIDVIPKNKCSITHSIDGHIQNIRVYNNGKPDLVFNRNTGIGTPPLFFALTTASEVFNGVNEPLKVLIFHFAKYNIPTAMRGGMVKNTLSKLRPIKNLIEAYCRIEEQYNAELSKTLPIEYIVGPKDGTIDDNARTLFDRTFNSSGRQKSFFMSTTKLEIQNINQTNIAPQYRQEMIELNKQIQVALGIPLSRLDSGATQYANQVNDTKRYLVGLVKPLADEIAGILTMVLRATIEEMESEKLVIQSDPETHLIYAEIQATNAVELLKGGIITVDEARAKNNYLPMTEEQKVAEAMRKSNDTLNSMFSQ